MKDIFIGLSLLWLLPWSVIVTDWIIKRECDSNVKK